MCSSNFYKQFVTFFLPFLSKLASNSEIFALFADFNPQKKEKEKEKTPARRKENPKPSNFISGAISIELLQSFQTSNSFVAEKLLFVDFVFVLYLLGTGKMEQGETATFHGPPQENSYNGQQVGGLMPPPHLSFAPCGGDNGGGDNGGGGAIQAADGGAATHGAGDGGVYGGGGFGGVGGSGVGFSFGERPKKKMGRPRKYDVVSDRSALSTGTPPPGFTLTPSSSSDLSKRRRGRPPGSRNRQKPSPLGVLLPGAAGVSFTPYVTTVKTGEDVLARILSFSLSGPRGVCVLSATGTVSNVAIRQPGSPNGATFSYEGRFEILSLMGSYVANDSGGRSITGGLSISLAGADGRVIGGAVAGILRAATPIQMVVGSFMTGAFKVKRKYKRRAQNPYTISPNVQDGSMIQPFAAVPMAAAGVPASMISSPLVNSQSQSQSRSQSQSQSHDDTSDDSRSIQNLNMEPAYVVAPERNGLGHGFDHQNTSPDINMFPPGEH